MLAIKTILHPTDFSEASQCGLKLACGLAADHNAHLVVIHVMAAPVILPDGAVLPMLRRRVDGASERDIPDDGVDIVRRAEESAPATEILNMAQLCDADLIVMGSNGRDGRRRCLTGSVAEAVMRKATCPVLTVTSPTA